MPELTIPKQLSKKELHETVLDSIQESGWNIKSISNVEKSPLRIKVSNGDSEEDLLVYIWNISHGGKTRNIEEYRIQMKGGSLTVGDSFKTLLLGWFDQEKVFAAFDAFKHRQFGRSPSVQVTKTALDNAAKNGTAFHTKQTQKGQDVVFTFQPKYMMDYVSGVYPQYHKNELPDISNEEAKILEKGEYVEITKEALDNIPKERRVAITTISKKIREATFKKFVYSYYGGQCVICGLQARLTEAAHIISVSEGGTDELENGILLCRNHHRAYDSGLLGINDDYTIILNKKQADFLRKKHLDNKLSRFIKSSRIGKKIFLPTDNRYYPKKDYLRSNCKSKGI